MDVGSQVVFGLGIVMMVNLVVPRLGWVRDYPALFWAINGVNAAVGLGALVVGVPGFEGHPIVRFMVGLAMLMHLAQNFAAKSRWEAEDRMARLDDELRARGSFDD
ncbi:MAG: hypothetical protein ABMA64_09600 [Myxococcota bacterium]